MYEDLSGEFVFFGCFISGYWELGLLIHCVVPENIHIPPKDGILV